MSPANKSSEGAQDLSPSVCAIMLTKDRPELARRAVECFRAQTYANKRILVVNSGPKPLFPLADDLWEPLFPGADAKTIGFLRNIAALYCQAMMEQVPDILIHWDDDDWSHPNRIAEQVALLQSGAAEVVGYREMLFWRAADAPGNQINGTGEAWLYSGPRNSPAGTSLCYWRKTWEAKHFEALPVARGGTGEDTKWLMGLKVESVSSFVGGFHKPDGLAPPRMIARIHSANTQDYDPISLRRSASWKRAPEWDDHCRRVMVR